MDFKKLRRSFFIVLIAVAAITGIADTSSMDFAQKSLSRALVTFGVARTLNGVISVAQGTELAFEPGGVGVIVTPGQVLDPVNDLIERFSSVMLVAASSLGLQIILLKITSTWQLTILLVVALVAWLTLVWSSGATLQRYKGIIVNATLLLVFIRFAVPVVVICTNLLFNTFLLDEHNSAAAALEGTSAKIEGVSKQNEVSEGTGEGSQAENEGVSNARESSEENKVSWFEMTAEDLKEIASKFGSSTTDLGARISNWVDSVSVGEKLDMLKTSAAEATEHIIDLIVVFVLQTVLLPIGFLWLFVEVLKTGAAKTISSISE